MDVEPQILVCTKCIFLVESTLWRKQENRVAHKNQLCLLFHHRFTLLPSEGESTTAKALKKKSVRLCGEYIIVTQVKRLD
jgi:hypothetical protein